MPNTMAECSQQVQTISECFPQETTPFKTLEHQNERVSTALSQQCYIQRAFWYGQGIQKQDPPTHAYSLKEYGPQVKRSRPQSTCICYGPAEQLMNLVCTWNRVRWWNPEMAEWSELVQVAAGVYCCWMPMHVEKLQHTCCLLQPAPCSFASFCYMSGLGHRGEWSEVWPADCDGRLWVPWRTAEWQQTYAQKESFMGGLCYKLINSAPFEFSATGTKMT